MLCFKIIGYSEVMLPLFNNNKPLLITLIKQPVQSLHPFTNFNKPSWGVGRLAVGLFILSGVMAMFSLRERERREIKSCLDLSHLSCVPAVGEDYAKGFRMEADVKLFLAVLPFLGGFTAFWAGFCTPVGMAEGGWVLLGATHICS